MGALPYWTESAEDFVETETVGSFNRLAVANSFDTAYTEACENLSNAHQGIRVNSGFLTADVLNQDVIVSDFKHDLLSIFESAVDELSAKMQNEYHVEDADVGNVNKLYDSLCKLYDNKIEAFKEEANSVGTMLPIKSIDFPILVKEHVTNNFKDVVNTEITPKLLIKKQIEHKIVYAKADPTKQWEYPQCFLNDEFLEIAGYGLGEKVDTKAVTLPLYNYNIVEELTGAPSTKNNRIQLNLEIDKVEVEDGTIITLRKPMYVNLADGMWCGGAINDSYTPAPTESNPKPDPVVVNDVVTGFIDWATGCTSLNSASGMVKKVHFSGRLSNDNNQNTVRFTYKREDMEWKIEEGFKVDSGYTLEQLQEHKAYMNEDLYKKTYDDLTALIADMEDSDGFKWLDEEFHKYEGLDLDPLQWNPTVKKTSFDCDSTISTVALPSEYIAKELKFKIDRFLIDLSDDVKMDNMKFVIYGNPRYISLLDPAVKWVFRTGDRIGGVKLDYSYGVMTSGQTSVYVVSSKKLNAKKHNTLRLIPFAPEGDTITFKRYKFSTDFVTAKESAYHDTEKAGGTYTYVWGAARYKDVSLQAIQGDIAFENADFITL